jgi:hypothetical protein
MTMYARSDIQRIFVGEAHGGCGLEHVREIGTDGYAVAAWAVDCPQCEAFLEGDPHWSKTIADIPLTVDEDAAAKQYEKIGAAQQSALLTAAVARLAGFEGAEISPVIKGMISGQRPALGPVMMCPSGHAGNVPGSRFCSSCGAALSVAQAPRELTSR